MIGLYRVRLDYTDTVKEKEKKDNRKDIVYNKWKISGKFIIIYNKINLIGY